MATKITTRKLELFAVHVVANGTAGPYLPFFQYIERLAVKDRITSFGERLFAFEVFRQIGSNIFELRVIEGPLSQELLIFNYEDGVARTEGLDTGEVVAHRTHAILDIARRRIAIEYVRSGAKAHHIASLMEDIAAKSDEPKFREMIVSLTTIPNESFLREIAEFERVRTIELGLAMPNAGFGDHFPNLLGELIETTGGAAGDVEIRAPRGKSLRKRGGLMTILRNIVQDAHPYLQKAIVRGFKRNSEAEDAASLKRQNVNKRVRFEVNDAGAVRSDEVSRQLSQFIAEN